MVGRANKVLYPAGAERKKRERERECYKPCRGFGIVAIVLITISIRLNGARSLVKFWPNYTFCILQVNIFNVIIYINLVLFMKQLFTRLTATGLMVRLGSGQHLSGKVYVTCYLGNTTNTRNILICCLSNYHIWSFFAPLSTRV